MIVDPNMLIVKLETAHKTKLYELPDGNIIELCDERFRCPEAFFKPSHLGLEAAGIHNMTVQTIMTCDKSIQKILFSNVVLSGGNTMFEGIQQRMAKELIALAPSGTPVKVVAPPERKYSAWIGGSIAATMILDKAESLPQKCILKDEYDRSGPQVVHTTCPESQ